MVLTPEGRGGDNQTAIQAVCFDAFGTLVEITDKRGPFRALLGEGPRGQPSADALISPLGLSDLARELSIEIGEARLQELEHDLAAECRSVRLRPGMDLIWSLLRRASVKIGICSNLALPYAEPLLGVIPGIPNALIFSFEVGFAKPQPEIFHLVCKQLGMPAKQILFVGDTLDADVLGPQTIGMHAMTIGSFQAALGQGAGHHPSTCEQVPPPVRQLLDLLRTCVCS